MWPFTKLKEVIFKNKDRLLTMASFDGLDFTNPQQNFKPEKSFISATLLDNLKKEKEFAFLEKNPYLLITALNEVEIEENKHIALQKLAWHLLFYKITNIVTKLKSEYRDDMAFKNFLEKEYPHILNKVYTAFNAIDLKPPLQEPLKPIANLSVKDFSEFYALVCLRKEKYPIEIANDSTKLDKYKSTKLTQLELASQNFRIFIPNIKKADEELLTTIYDNSITIDKNPLLRQIGTEKTKYLLGFKGLFGMIRKWFNPTARNTQKQINFLEKIQNLAFSNNINKQSLAEAEQILGYKTTKNDHAKQILTQTKQYSAEIEKRHAAIDRQILFPLIAKHKAALKTTYKFIDDQTVEYYLREYVTQCIKNLKIIPDNTENLLLDLLLTKYSPDLTAMKWQNIDIEARLRYHISPAGLSKIGALSTLTLIDYIDSQLIPHKAIRKADIGENGQLLSDEQLAPYRASSTSAKDETGEASKKIQKFSRKAGEKKLSFSVTRIDDPSQRIKGDLVLSYRQYVHEQSAFPLISGKDKNGSKPGKNLSRGSYGEVSLVQKISGSQKSFQVCKEMLIPHGDHYQDELNAALDEYAIAKERWGDDVSYYTRETQDKQGNKFTKFYLILPVQHGYNLQQWHDAGRFAKPDGVYLQFEGIYQTISQLIDVHHINGRAHRDIKANNIMLDLPKTGVPRFTTIDDGLSALFGPKKTLLGTKGHVSLSMCLASTLEEPAIPLHAGTDFYMLGCLIKRFNGWYEKWDPRTNPFPDYIDYLYKPASAFPELNKPENAAKKALCEFTDELMSYSLEKKYDPLHEFTPEESQALKVKAQQFCAQYKPESHATPPPPEYQYCKFVW